jgi:hypothetical protein
VVLAALVLLYPLLSWSPRRRKAVPDDVSGTAPEPRES